MRPLIFGNGRILICEDRRGSFAPFGWDCPLSS